MYLMISARIKEVGREKRGSSVVNGEIKDKEGN